MSRYEEDEFDIVARDRGPSAAHRRLEPVWKRYLPYIALIILAPFLAWGIMYLVTDSRTPAASNSPAPVATHEPSKDEGVTEEPGEDATVTAEITPEPSPTVAEPTPSPSPSEIASEPDRGQSVAVLNASGIKGLAGRVAQQLQDSGYTHVTSGNFKGAQSPRVNTVYYNSPAFEAAAREIAQRIGIDQVVESTKATRAITVVLRGGVR